MTDQGIFSKWHAVAERLVRSSGDSLPPAVRDELFELQKEVVSSLREDPSPDEPNVRFVLDALVALSLSEPGDPSHPWARGGLLARLGRHLEAAEDYLLAARLFAEEAERGDGLTGDEAEWASAARAHAARNLALGGQPVAAIALLRTLDVADRRDVEPIVGKSLDDLEQLAAG